MPQDTPNARCPVCGRRVVAAPNSIWSPWAGRWSVERAPGELEAACPEHGGGPASQLTLAYERAVEIDGLGPEAERTWVDLLGFEAIVGGVAIAVGVSDGWTVGFIAAVI